MNKPRQVFEAIARNNGATDFSMKPDGRYAVQNIQSRWVYFKLGWDEGLARERVGLTDDELRELEKEFRAERVRTSDEEYLVIYPSDYYAWQRAIEAKLREKNT